VGSRYAREDKKTGIFGYKRFRVPVNKASLIKFHDVRVFHTRLRRTKGLFRFRFVTLCLFSPFLLVVFVFSLPLSTLSSLFLSPLRPVKPCLPLSPCLPFDTTLNFPFQSNPARSFSLPPSLCRRHLPLSFLSLSPCRLCLFSPSLHLVFSLPLASPSCQSPRDPVLTRRRTGSPQLQLNCCY
jgi:hypothetical protein